MPAAVVERRRLLPVALLPLLPLLLLLLLPLLLLLLGPRQAKPKPPLIQASARSFTLLAAVVAQLSRIVECVVRFVFLLSRNPRAFTSQRMT